MLAVKNVCRLPAPPEAVWPLYTDPAQWTTWSEDIEHARADDPDEPLHAGTTGTCKYRLLPTGRFEFMTLDAPRSFLLDWTMLGTTVRFAHELRPIGEHATHVCERISYHGLLAPILGLLERTRIRTHWPRAMDCLATLALEAYREQHGKASGTSTRRPSSANGAASRSPSSPIPDPADTSRTHQS